MTSYLSKKIKIISFVAMLFIVFLHGQLISISTGISQWIQCLLTQEITRVAVPLFFLISGYLFFRNCKDPTSHFFYIKIKKRFYTLVIPFFLWSLLGFLFLYIISFVVPVSSIGEMKLNDILYAIFISPVGAYQLWFLRDLYILVILTPVIYWGIKKMKVFLLICLLLLWINGIQYLVQTESVFFFVTGGYIALFFNKWSEKIHKNHLCNLILFIAWISYSCFIVNVENRYLLHCIGILVGINCVWYCYDSMYLFFSEKVLSSNIYSYSFFIYLLHEPLLTCMKKILLGFSFNNAHILFVYFISPCLTIFVCIIIGKWVNYKLPTVYKILVGGR